MRYKINEIAKLLNVSTNTVRRYEGYGHIQSVRDKNNTYRYYNKGDLTRLMNIRVLRKYGFAHKDIINMKDNGIEQLIQHYQEQDRYMESEIVKLTNLRHRLRDDLILLQKTNNIYQHLYIRDSIAYSYVLYQSGAMLLLEEDRIKKIHEFLYKAPKVQMIYLIKKEDISLENIKIHMGWAMKVSDLEQSDVEENEFTQRYPTRKTLMSLEKLPVNAEIIHRNSLCQNELFKEATYYMKEHNLSVGGDLLGVKIATIVEEGEELEYILFNIPIEEKE